MMVEQVVIKPELISWAIKRSETHKEDLMQKFPKLDEWQKGKRNPTIKQLEDFAKRVHVPIGFLFLSSPPEEVLPVVDFRSLPNRRTKEPSPNLLDTLYLCQQRQDWYREYALIHKLEVVKFIGSASQNDNPVKVANHLRLNFNIVQEEIQKLSNNDEALSYLTQQAERAGVLVMKSSIVGSNSHRKLNLEEFRGFALSDNLAPLVFINSSDSKAAQIFTLAHELAHLCLGESGVSDSIAGKIPENNIELWCNSVAAEILVPIDLLKQSYSHNEPTEDAIKRLSKLFKVSTLVILRRLFDAGFIKKDELRQLYKKEEERIQKLEKRKSDDGGGDFYRTLSTRTSKRFVKAVITSTLEGRTLFQDAFRLLKIRKNSTFYQAARELEVIE